MHLGWYVDRLRAQFAAISEVAGPDVRDVAERLVTPLESTVRLVLLEALSGAADEITLDLAPGSVHVRLNGSDPEFVIDRGPAGSTGTATTETTTAPTTATTTAPATSAAPAPLVEPDGGPVARINFRPPESLKTRIEEAAARDGLSVNTWLTRAASAALDPPPPRAAAPSDRARTGWFG